MAVKIKPFDTVFSNLVRERAAYQCECCGSRENLQCAHVFGRIRYTVRCDDRNAYCLCASCHYTFTQDPLAWADFVRSKMGNEVYDDLRLVANRPAKFTKQDKADMTAHLRRELKRVEGLRAEGVVGRIEFEGWRVA